MLSAISPIGYYFTPKNRDVNAWQNRLRGVEYMDIREMITLHRELHRQFGADPVPEVIEGEQAMSRAMRSCGLEHRYTDALATQAATVVANPVAPDLGEVSAYIESIPVRNGVVKFSQGVEDASKIYIEFDPEVISPNFAAAIQRQMMKMLPPGIALEAIPQEPGEDYRVVMPAYDFLLSRAYGTPEVVPWKKLLEASPEQVFKSGKNIQLKWKQVVKEDAEERFVLGPVLIPEEEDTQGEIYSEEEVRKACHWWAEYSGKFAEKHVLQGGRGLNTTEFAMLENYVMPTTCKMGEKEIKQGAWMLGGRALSEKVWEKCKSGELNAWSIGAEVLAGEESVVTEERES